MSPRETFITATVLALFMRILLLPNHFE